MKRQSPSLVRQLTPNLNDNWQEECVHRVFEAQVKRTPDQIAVIYPARKKDTPHEQLTYRELNQRANLLAHQLQAMGVGPDKLVGLFVEPSVAMIVGLLAILKAGGAYLPLDISAPPERLAFMLEDSQVSLLLTEQHLQPQLPRHDCPLLYMDREWPTVAYDGEQNLQTATTSNHLIYVMYTSGSTGVPKGVAIRHGAVHQLVCHQNYIAIRPGDRIGQGSTVAFDAATFEIWGSLLHGATVVGIPKETMLAPGLLAEFLRQQQVSIIFLTTALFNQVASTVPDAFRTLRYVLFGGEAVAPRWVAEVLKHGAPEHLLHMYGPTECTTYATWYRVSDVPPHAMTIPIGHAITGTEIHVLDEQGQPVPAGTPGELYISGAGLARGYLNRPALNAEKFVQASWESGLRLYRTGDVVRCLPDGNIEFIGRTDNQVKIRGFRIELGEIEAALGAHPAIHQVVVNVHEDQAGEKRLAAYFVTTNGYVPNAQEMRDLLKTRLPGYMIPQTFIRLPALPLNQNGKVDRRALPAPDIADEDSAPVVAPRTTTEAALARIWSQVLRQRSVGMYDNFFELGGHSLLAVQAMAAVERELQLRLPVTQFFALPTIAEQAQWLDDNAAPSEVVVQTVRRQEAMPLSFPQRQLWMFAQLHPSEPVYNETLVYYLPERINANVLAQAFTLMVERHEAFRTTFTVVDDQPLQIIHAAQPVPLRTVDLTHLPLAEREPAAHELATAELTAPFNLEHGPLFRATLVKLAETDYRLYLSVHHLILDGVSMYSVFLPELETAYRALLEGRAPSLPALTTQQADFAAWQEQHLTDEALADQLAYWTQQLAQLPVLQLPTDRPATAKTSYRGARQCLHLSPELTEQLKSLSRAEGVTLFVTLAAAINVLLHRYTGQEDIVLGTVHSGRSRWEWQQVIGNFLNNMVLRTNVAGEPSFRELLARVKTVLAEAYQHPDVPFEKLVKALQPERLPYQNPLFQVAFVMEPPLPTQDVRWGLSQLDIHSGTSKFDLLVELDERPEGIIGRIEYGTDLFDDATIKRLIGHLQTLLEGIVTNPDAKIAHLPLLTANEQHQLLQEWNQPAMNFPPSLSLPQWFEAQVERTPDKVAVVFEGQELTYRELNARANKLAHYLHGLGVGRETLVGMYIERSLEMVVGILGILKAGGAYVPLDLSYPKERVAFMLADSGARVLLTTSAGMEKLNANGAEASQPSGFFSSPESRIVCLDTHNDQLTQSSDENLACEVTPDNLAYVIYTSGSTGQPKGVMVTHYNAVRLLQATQHWYEFSEDDVWTLFHSYAFDFSVWELWGALLYGGRLVVVSYQVSRSPEAFYELLRREQVTVLNQTPSAFRQLMQAEAIADNPNALALRLVIFGGEALELQSLKPWFDRHGDQFPQLVNMYGITETTVHVSYRPITAEDVRQGRGSVIGCAIPDLQIYVLDQHRQPVPVGIPGEMYVGGAGVARGYLHRPELTAEKFISENGSPKLYRTGDLAQYLPDGDIEYLGRCDQQVKIRGFRIELGEVEAELNRSAAVRECSVMVREDAPGEKRLVAYLVLEAGADCTIRDLRAFLQMKLPDYMLPAAFVTLPALPLTPHGKVDRRALPAPERARPELAGTCVAPRTPTEALLAQLWAEVLDLEQVGVTDNFFELGGDSMRAIKVLAKACQQGLGLSLAQLFKHQTIAALAQLCQPDEAPAPVPEIASFGLLSDADRQLLLQKMPDALPGEIEDAYPLSVLQAGMIYHTEIDPGTDVYHDLMGSRIELPLEVDSLRGALQQLVARHPVLRTSVALTGFSEPLQLVHRNITLPVMVEDIQHLSAPEQEAVIDAWFAQEKRRAFDWETAPLWLVQVHQREPECFYLTLSFHHILMEGWSIASLLTELFELYLQALGRSTKALPPPPISRFRDFVAHERQVIQTEAVRDYWVNKFADKPLPQLPRWPVSYRVESQPGVVELQVPGTLTERLRQLAHTAKVPLKSVLLAAHLRTLQLHSNQAAITTGLVTNIRPTTTDAERVLGLYLNTLPFYLGLSGGTWIDLVQATFQAEQADIAYREYPLAEIQRQVGRPLFETVFNIVHFHVYQDLLQHEGLSGINVKVFQRTNFPLLTSFVLHPRSGQLERIVMDYDGSEVCREQAETIGASYLDILSAMSDAPEERYEARRFAPVQSVLEEVDAAENQGGLHTLFEAQVARTPDAIALVAPTSAHCDAGTTYLTYRELNQRANQLAHYLQALGVGPEMLVGLCVERTAEMVIALLGILKAGGAYVPFDPKYPQSRLAFMQQDAQLQMIVTQANLRAKLLERLPDWQGACVCLDTERDAIAVQRQENPKSDVSGEHLAYVLYTSGSTGVPKGVAIEHRQTMNLLHWANATYTSEELQGVLAATSLNFDLSVFEILAPLSWGGKVILAENILHLPTLPTRDEITLVNTVPSLLTDYLLEQLPASVRVVNFAGEPLRETLVQKVYEQTTVAKVFNLYGPTEATTYATGTLIPRGQEHVITIGHPLRATEVQILDEHLQPVPVGVPGELYLGGAGLARGYLHRPELTDERFIAHPFRPGARLYKTGDLARWLPDNSIEFLGRLDRQVKLRGLRIELPEIEAALLRQPAVQDAVVIAREDRPGNPYLAAYLVTTDAPSVTNCDWRSALQQHLPTCMVPHSCTVLDRLPLNANGKVDHQALPLPVQLEQRTAERYVAPRTPAEQHLADLWAELLGLAKVGIHENFFELGGHSLLGMEMIARASHQGLPLTIRQLYQTPTIADLARANVVSVAVHN